MFVWCTRNFSSSKVRLGVVTLSQHIFCLLNQSCVDQGVWIKNHVVVLLLMSLLTLVLALTNNNVMFERRRGRCTGTKIVH